LAADFADYTDLRFFDQRLRVFGYPSRDALSHFTPFMNTNLRHRDTTQAIIGGFYDVYNQLGHGFLESVYESALEIDLKMAGIPAKRQEEIGVFFRGHCVGKYVADLIVNDQVVVELKAARAIAPAHEAQLLNLLEATRIEVGLLLNFGPTAEFRRMVLSNFNKPYVSAKVNPRDPR
jgi:GxxExxY protein